MSRTYCNAYRLFSTAVLARTRALPGTMRIEASDWAVEFLADTSVSLRQKRTLKPHRDDDRIK
jgi:hypothetical protein